jgi:hypothetical protein
LAVSVATDAARAAIVSARTFSGEAVKPNPVPWTPAISRISSVAPAVTWPARYFAIAVDSPKLSLRSRSLRDTSMPEPVTPACSCFHSSGVKSAFVAIDVLRVECPHPGMGRRGIRYRRRARDLRRSDLAARGYGVGGGATIVTTPQETGGHDR